MNDVLAEVAGIFAGDGTLYKTNRSYVVEVRGHIDEFPYYTSFVAPLFGEIFNKTVEVRYRNCGTCVLVGVRLCGREVYEKFHVDLGFPVGTKSRTVEIPVEILCSKNESLRISYLRGVFDIDESIGIRILKKKYVQPFLSFTTVSDNHKDQIHDLLSEIGFNCWKEKYRVRMAGWSTVKRFFNLINPHNHLRIGKWNEILANKAQVA